MERATRPIAVIALEMNGAPLERRHGFPARLLAPGSYGEVSVKWITRIEVRTDEAEGYYARQGWKADHVETMSRFFDLRAGSRIDAGRVELRGVAFAGDRGISRVEVSADGGRTWRAARLTYNPSPLAWTLWSLPWAARPGHPRAGGARHRRRGDRADRRHPGHRPRGLRGLAPHRGHRCLSAGRSRS